MSALDYLLGVAPVGTWLALALAASLRGTGRNRREP